MDYKFEQKIENNSIKIAILYEKSEYKNALLLKNKIDNKYKNGIKNYNVKATISLYSETNIKKANIYYLFPTTNENIKKIVTLASKHKALTFSYFKEDLQYGVMISLNIGNKIKPIINLDAIKLHNITFRPLLLKISKIYKVSNNILPYKGRILKYNKHIMYCDYKTIFSKNRKLFKYRKYLEVII